MFEWIRSSDNSYTGTCILHPRKGWFIALSQFITYLIRLFSISIILKIVVNCVFCVVVCHEVFKIKDITINICWLEKQFRLILDRATFVHFSYKRIINVANLLCLPRQNWIMCLICVSIFLSLKLSVINMVTFCLRTIYWKVGCNTLW